MQITRMMEVVLVFGLAFIILDYLKKIKESSERFSGKTRFTSNLEV